MPKPDEDEGKTTRELIPVLLKCAESYADCKHWFHLGCIIKTFKKSFAKKGTFECPICKRYPTGVASQIVSETVYKNYNIISAQIGFTSLLLLDEDDTQRHPTVVISDNDPDYVISLLDSDDDSDYETANRLYRVFPEIDDPDDYYYY